MKPGFLPPIFALLLLASTLGSSLPQTDNSPDWGFFAHRRINRLAVFTLPPEMMVFFKPNIDWVADHAPDPDMRRYATTWEAPRHYIDLDNFGAPPFDNLPRTWPEALRKFSDVYGIDAAGDTLLLAGIDKPVDEARQPLYARFFNRSVLPLFYKNEKDIDPDSLNRFLAAAGIEITVKKAFFHEHLSENGILPWHLQKMQKDLTAAFRARDSKRILKLCADMGHYIGDGHVPLHTTSNYNGQKTGQHGIHGFWESRIPELFADEQYDYFVGKPTYIEDKTAYFWEVVLESHKRVDSVLTLERLLRQQFPADRQMCPDMRNGVMIVAPCRDYAAAYQDVMQGMVERRMRQAIHSVASSWYTAWVDAGQPDMRKLDVPIASAEDLEEEAQLKKAFQAGRILGRAEEH